MRQLLTCHSLRNPHRQRVTHPTACGLAFSSSPPLARGVANVWLVLLALVLASATVAPLFAGERAALEPWFMMYRDPELTVPPVQYTLDPRNVELWREALRRPEAEYQYRAADAISRAQRQGFPDLHVAVPELLKLLQDQQTQPFVKAAAAQALITLDASESSALLWESARTGGFELRQIVEPALARWNFQPIRSVWQDRLINPVARRQDVLLAISGVAAVGDTTALRHLLAIVRDPLRPDGIRLAAAQAAGALADSGLEPFVVDLMGAAGTAKLPRLCAVALLSRHSSETARKQLLGLARDPEPTVAGPALKRLFAIDPGLLVPLVSELAKHVDAGVRSWAAQTYLALPSVERIPLLAELLDDPHPNVRKRVREGLFDVAHQAEFRAAVETSALHVLSRDSWRGQEQATLLLAALDHEPAASRLVDLLESPRPEVMVAAAWGLRMLAVPQTLPAILNKAERQTVARTTGTLTVDFQAVDRQVGHLFEALALMNADDAIPLMKRYVAKNTALGEYSRAAAIWGLGLLLKDSSDEELANQLMGRAKDIDGMPPELELVRQMCAVTLGRMKASSQLEQMKKLLGPIVDPDHAEVALRWAIREISGEELPPPQPRIIPRGGWFLMSTRPATP